MVDKTTEPGGLTSKADANKERVAEVSNVSRTINEMQKKVDQEIVEANLNVGDFEHIEKVQNSMIKVLSSLAHTVDQVGRGFVNVAAGTAKAGKDVISQYGKAISQDISFNKQNIVAMALTKSTPIFGYFASKFMETDVFKSAAAKMKANIAETLGGAFSKITSKFRDGLGGLFSKSKKEKPIKTIHESAGGIPKMQKGGFVEKAGLAFLHPAEIVVPIDKILSKIDDSISTTKDLVQISRKAQLKSMAKMSTYVQSVEHLEKVGIFKGFTRALNETYSRHTEPSNVRMLRAVLAIQDSMGAQIGTWEQVWQKMLVQHPTFRNIMFSLKSIKNIAGMPFKAVYQIFKSRGGYKRHLSRSKNPAEAAAHNIGLVYTEGMWRLDNIALFTKASAEATRDISSFLTGAQYSAIPGISKGRWSFFSLLRGGLAKLGFEVGDKGKKRISRKKELRGLYSGLSPELSPGISPESADATLREMKKWKKQEKADKKKLLGYTKNISKVNEEDLEIQKKINLRQKIKSMFNVFSGSFGAIKSLLSVAMTFIPFLLGGGFRKMASKFISGALITGIKSIVKKGFITGAIKTGLKGLFTKGIFAKIGSVFSKIIPMLKRLMGFLGLGVAKGVAAKTAIESAKKGAAKGLSKLAGKAGLKMLVKKIPVIGLLAGLGFAAHRIMKGDFLGAGLEVASGAASLVPGLGTAASVAIDAGLIGRDVVKGKTPKTKSVKDKMTEFSKQQIDVVKDKMPEFRKQQIANFKKITGGLLPNPNWLKDNKAAIIVTDKFVGIVKNAPEIAMAGAAAATAQGKIITDELKAQGKAALEGTKGLAAATTQGLIQTSNSVSSSVQNISNLVNNNGGDTSQLSPQTRDVLQGNMSEA